MSVCFFVPAEQAGTPAEEVVDPEGLEESGDSAIALQQFWKKVNDDIKHINVDDFKTQALPLARIKKIMKLDDEVKMISSEAPVMFAKAAEIFIHELTLRAWEHTDSNRRRTLQRNDIAMAISKSDQFDFLIDIVPRHEVKPVKQTLDPLRVSERQVSPPPQPGPGAQPQFVVQQPQVAQVLQQSTAAGASSSSPHPVTLVRQMVPQQSAEVAQVPLQLTQEQLNMIRLQLQQNPNQPIIIQAARQQQTPQIIQVSSQGQLQPQQMYLAQVANNQDDS